MATTNGTPSRGPAARPTSPSHRLQSSDWFLVRMSSQWHCHVLLSYLLSCRIFFSILTE
jgi:hypothetical protein